MTGWKEHEANRPLRGAAARAYEDARREMGVGYLILQARAAAGLSQRQLARRIGTSQPTIARWESGAQLPSVRSLSRIARAIGFELMVGFRDGSHPRRTPLTVAVG